MRQERTRCYQLQQLNRQDQQGRPHHNPFWRLREQSRKLPAERKSRNYAVRMYQPREEILNGSWTFPVPVPVKLIAGREVNRPADRDAVRHGRYVTFQLAEVAVPRELEQGVPGSGKETPAEGHGPGSDLA